MKRDDRKRINLEEASDLDAIIGVECLLASLLTTVDHEKSKKGPIQVFNRLTKTINKYAKVVDVFIQQQPDITAVVWGTVRFLIQVSTSHTKIKFKTQTDKMTGCRLLLRNRTRLKLLAMPWRTSWPKYAYGKAM